MKFTKEEIVNNPSLSYWVKDAVKTVDERDPVDALRDITILKSFIENKLVTIKEQYERSNL